MEPSEQIALRESLEKRKRELDGEIRSYPAPITACDAQFNHLLEERERISRELRLLETTPG